MRALFILSFTCLIVSGITLGTTFSYGFFSALDGKDMPASHVIIIAKAIGSGLFFSFATRAIGTELHGKNWASKPLRTILART